MVESHQGGSPSRLSSAINKRLIGYGIGIFCCFFVFGIFQEKITRGKYGPDKEPFTFTQSLVFVQCVVNVAFAAAGKGRLNRCELTKPEHDDTPSELYAFSAFSYLAAMISSNHALQFVAYPTQVLGKSCKPIPIMILGFFLAGKRYSVAKYMFVMMIVAGVALFMYKDGKASSPAVQMGWGEVLLLISLTMDGFTGGIQEKIRAKYTSKSHQMMFNMNMWSTLYLLVGLLVTGEIVSFFVFVQKYHYIMFYMLCFSITSALGQNFIFLTVTEFGPLPCSIVTTTRKFFTILCSVIYFQNPLSGRQWLAVLLVFCGLTLDSFYGKGSGKPKAKTDS